MQIVDARPKSDFDAGHIPGAIWMGWEEWTHPAPASEGSILRRPGYWGVLREKPSHIPGAVLLAFTSLFDATGRYIDQASFVHVLPSAVRQTGDVVAYWEVGVRASVFALLHEAYTGRPVSVFDGSAAEWALQSERHLQTGMIS